MVDTKGRPGMTGRIQLIPDNPLNSYSGVTGPDDCDSEPVYRGTRKVLREYALHYAQNRWALMNCIRSGGGRCNGTRALLGKNFDIVIEAVGLVLSRLPCP
jgi:hypothetical protein